MAPMAGCVASPPSRAVPAPTTKAVTLVADSVESRSREITMRFRTTECDGASTGSGVVVGPHQIVTNEHVVDGYTKVEINSWKGDDYHVTGVRVASGHTDLAMVTVRQRLPRVASLNSREAPTGAGVVVSGFPEGERIHFADGRLLRYVGGGPYDQPQRVIRTSAKVEHGNSGGPLLDDAGRVVGVVFALDRRDDVGLAIDLATVKEFLDHGGRPLSAASCN